MINMTPNYYMFTIYNVILLSWKHLRKIPDIFRLFPSKFKETIFYLFHRTLHIFEYSLCSIHRVILLGYSHVQSLKSQN